MAVLTVKELRAALQNLSDDLPVVFVNTDGSYDFITCTGAAFSEKASEEEAEEAEDEGLNFLTSNVFMISAAFLSSRTITPTSDGQ